MPEAIIQGAGSTTDTQTEYNTGNKKRAPQAPAPTTAPIPKVSLPGQTAGQPKAPAPDTQTLQEKQAAAINQYIYSRAQRYLIGSSFSDKFETGTPGYPKSDATTGAAATWWTTHPVEFGNNIMSNVTEQQHRKLVKHIPGVYDWIANHDQVAGVNGTLTGMRLTALHITDPTIRSWALNYIDSIKSMSSGDQQAIMGYLMNLHGYTDPQQLLHEALHTRLGYVHAMEASPQYQQATALASKRMQVAAETGHIGGDTQQTMQAAWDEKNKLTADLQAQGKTPEQIAADPTVQMWQQAYDQAYQQYWASARHLTALNPNADRGVTGDLTTDVIAPTIHDVTQSGGKVLSFLGKKAVEGIAGPDAAQAVAHSMSDWMQNGNTLPFHIRFAAPKFDLQNIEHYVENAVYEGGHTNAIPGSQGLVQGLQHEPVQMKNYDIHHFSAQSEMMAAGAAASIVFAPGLVAAFGEQAVGMARVIAFMKLMHQVNQVAQQVGQSDQQVQYGGFIGDIMNPITHVMGTGIRGVAIGLHAATSVADNAMLDVQDNLATGTALTAQQFGWNMSAGQANIAAQIEMAMLMESMGRIGSDIKLNLGQTADTVAGQLGVGYNLSDTYRLSDSSLFHPWRAVMDPIVDYNVTRFMQFMHATDLPSVFERWNDSSWTGRAGLFDIVGKWQVGTDGSRTDPNTVLGKIRERYPMLPLDYAKVLAATPRDEMLGASTDYIHQWGTSEFQSTKGQLGSVRAKLAALPVLSDLPFVKLQGTDINAQGTPGDIPAEQITWVKTADLYNAEAAGPGSDLMRENRQGQVQTPQDPAYDTSIMQDMASNGWSKPVEVTVGDMSRRVSDGNHALEGAYQLLKSGDKRFEYTPVRVVEPVSDAAIRAQLGLQEGAPIRIQHLAQFGPQPFTGDVAAALNGIDVRPTDVSVMQEHMDLLAQQAALEDKLAGLQSAPNEVITNLPTNSMPDFLHRVMYQPYGVVEQAFHFVLNFGRYAKRFTNWSYRTLSGEDVNRLLENKQSWAAKLVDKLDSRPQLRYADPTMNRAERQVIEDNNAQILDRLLQRVGFSAEDAALLKGRLASAKTQEEWFGVVSRDLLGSKGDGLHLMSKYLPDNTPKWLKDRILGMTDSSTSPRYYQKMGAGKHGETQLEHLLPGELVQGSRGPLPAAPSMFLNSYNVPMSDIQTALSTVDRWRARVGDVSWKKGDLFNNLSAQVYDWGKAGLSMATAVGKPLAMVANIPAIVLTKMLDETMGNAMDPRILRQFKTRADALDYFSRIDPRIMGKVMAGGSWVGIDGVDPSTSYIEHTSQELWQRGMDRATAETVAQRLVDISTDPLLRRIIQEGNPDRVMAVLFGDVFKGVNPNAPGVIHLYRGSGVVKNDSTSLWWKGLFGRDTMANTHEDAITTARSYDANGGYQQFYLDPRAKILVQGTPEFDALAGGASSDFTSDPASLDSLVQAAKDAGYQAIHMTDQENLGTTVLDPTILRDPWNAQTPVAGDEALRQFFDAQLRPQIERSMDAQGVTGDVRPHVVPLRNVADTPEATAAQRVAKQAAFDAGSDPAYVYHWMPQSRFDRTSGEGLLPSKPADVTPPGPRGVYFGDSAQAAYDALPMKSARDAVLVRVPAETSGLVPTERGIPGELISPDAVGASSMEWFGNDGQWHQSGDARESAVRARTRQLIVDWQHTIDESAMSHPDLIDFAKHGRLGARGLTIDQAASMDGELKFKYDSLQAEAANLREHLSGLDQHDNPAAFAAAQRQLHDKLAQIDHIENTVLGAGDQTDRLLGGGQIADQVRQDTQKELADHVERLWKNSELTPPDKFTVRTDTFRRQNSSTTDEMRRFSQKLQEFMYKHGQFKVIGKAEGAYAKGSFYSQRADTIAKGYIASGMKPEEAVALAEWKALDETRDMNYDITAKSTAERSIRNIMWFAPVQGELMYRWMYAIPATMGAWLPGAALMTARLTNWYHMLQTSGLIHKDQYTGQDVVTIPGLSNLIQHASQAITGKEVKLPDTLEIPLTSINPHLFGIIKNPLPTLSPGPSFLLDEAAHYTHSPLLLSLSTLVSQGGTNQFVPSGINSILGMYGINIGTHMMGTSYQKLQWDRAHDVGLQYAWVDMQKSGNLPPTLSQFGLDSAAKGYIQPSASTSNQIQEAQLQYQVAWSKWFDQFQNLGDAYARGAYALNAVSSTVLPGYIQESSTNQRAYQQFFQDHILPKIDAGVTGTVISDAINKWVAQHPNSQAFAVSYNYYTGKQWDTPFQVTDPQYAQQLYLQGIKEPMAPTDYANFLSGKAMIEGYRAQLNTAINQAAPDGQWQTLLRNWYKRGTAIDQYTQELNMFDQMNPDALRTYNDVQAKAQQAGHVYPHQGVVYQYVAQAMTDLKILAPGMFGQAIQGDYKSIMSQLGEAKSKLYQQFPGAANDPMTKGINWYFDNVISPYYKAVNPLYQKAKQLQAQGADTAAITDVYHQIDLIRQQYDNPGQHAPSPEEFSYASMSPYDQKVAQLSWATQPVSWLSKFQYNHVYGGFSPGVDKMFNWQYKFDKNSFLPLYNTTSPSSNYADSLRQWRDQQYQIAAQYYQKHGVPDAVKVMNLEQAAPYVRLQYSGWEKDNKGMQTILDLAKQANDAITAAGNSPAGFSQTAVAWKSWFYDNLNNWLTAPTTNPDGSANPQVVKLNRAMDMLSQSQKTVGTTGLHPSGLALYEEIFFGNYSLDKYPAPTSITNLFK